MKKIRNAFITGVLVLVPVVATVNLLLWFVGAMESAVRVYLPTTLFPIDFPGLGLVISIAVIIGVGAAAMNHLGHGLFAFFDASLKRTPLVGGIYSTIRKFLETILNPRSDKFHGVVLVRFPSNSHWSIGFRTGKPDRRLIAGRENLVNVFVPCTPNPTSGFYILAVESELVPLDISVQDAFKILLSMGVATLDEA